MKLSELRRKVLTIEKVVFYSLDLRQWQTPSLPRMRLPVRFAFGREEDIECMAADDRLNLGGRSDFYLQKLQMGHKLLLGTRNEEILFYLWVVSGEKILMNKVLALEPQQIAIERAFVRKDVRGHGLFVHGLNYLLPLEKEEGAANCLTEVSCKNRPMTHTVLKYGFERLDSSYYWISHPLRHHAIVLGPLRKRSRPNTIISPMAGAQGRYLWKAEARSQKPGARSKE